MKKFYTAKNDLVFKYIMINNKCILKALLESILRIPIDDIEYLDKELVPSKMDIKKKYLDLLVKSNNKYINVELNANKREWQNYRNVGYLFEVYNKNIPKGSSDIESYQKIIDLKFISINLSYGLSREYPLVANYYIQDEHQKKFIDNFEIIEINMDKIDLIWYDLSNKEKKNYQYLKMLDLDKKELDSFCKGDAIMKKFKEEIKKTNKDDWAEFFKEWHEKDEVLYRNSVIQDMIDDAKKETALEVTKEVTKQVTEENIKQVAINLFKNGAPIDLITKSLNISEKELNNILQEK